MSTRLLPAMLAAAGATLFVAGTASAMPITPQAPAPLVQSVAWGCGMGWHPNPWGRCVPNRPAYVYNRPVIVYPYGWYRPGWGWYHPRMGWYRR